MNIKMNNQQRMIEFAAGLYSHPDVSKFIYQTLNAGVAEVCSNLLTPISSPFTTFPLGGCFNPPKNSPFGGVQIHNPSFGSGTPFAVSGGQVMTSFGGQNPTLFKEDMELKVNVEPQQIYIYSKDEIKKRNSLRFGISTYYSPRDAIIGKPRILMITTKPIFGRSDKVNVPPGYTKQDDYMILHKYILKMGELPEYVKQGKQDLLYEFHLFLRGFEYLLKEFIIPKILNYQQNGLGNLTKYITLPVLMAFGNEFSKTPLSFENYILIDKDEKKISKDKKFIEDYSKKMEKNYLKTIFNVGNDQFYENFINCMNMEYIKNMYDLYN